MNQKVQKQQRKSMKPKDGSLKSSKKVTLLAKLHRKKKKKRRIKLLKPEMKEGTLCVMKN